MSCERVINFNSKRARENTKDGGGGGDALLNRLIQYICGWKPHKMLPRKHKCGKASCALNIQLDACGIQLRYKSDYFIYCKTFY